MKQNIFRRIGSFLLVLALFAGLLPVNWVPVHAAVPAWTHMSEAEAATNMAAYDTATGKMTLKNDPGWAARMQYTGLADAAGKDWTIEFDMVTAGGAIGVYQYDASGALYGAYLDTNGAAMDSVRFDDWTTCKDGFFFFEGKPAEAAAPGWTAADKTNSHIRVDFVRGSGGTMAGGVVTYYKKNLTTNQYIKLGTLAVPSTVKDNTSMPNMFGIHLVLGEATLSNLTVKEYKPINWVHMSDVEMNTGKAIYDAVQDKMTLKNDPGWAARMQYTGLADAAGKDWSVEFDMVTAGGAIGVYQYDASGALYGAYLDTNAAQLDSVRFDDWVTCKDNFYFLEGKPAEAAAPGWTAADKTKSHIRVDFVRGSSGTMAGGTVTYYKKNLTTGQYIKLGALNVSAEVKDNTSMPNIFGIHLVMGEATLSNLTVKEYKPINWVHMSDTEATMNKASFDANTGTMTLKNDPGWAARMQYVGLADAAGKDWTIEFDMVTLGGALGVYQYDGSGALYGAYLDTNAAALDSVRFDDWATCKDNFYFLEGKPAEAAAPNWTAADKTKSHIRVDFVRGPGGTMAGGTVTYYKTNLTTGQYIKLGTLNVPSAVKDNAALPNIFGIHLIMGEATLSNLTVREYKSVNWIHMSDAEMNAGLAVYDPATDKISFKNDPGWANRMQYVGLPDVAGKDWTIEFDAAVDGGALGVYQYDGSGALYGAYLDTNGAKLDAIVFDDWATCKDGFYFYGDPTPPVQASNWDPAIDKANSHIRVDFNRGSGGTMAGGTVTYYKRTADNQYVKIGTLNVPSTVKDNETLPNFFGVHLVLGNGTLQNMTVKEFTGAPGEPVDPDWIHMSPTEQGLGKASYDVAKNEITFVVDSGFAARMQYTALADIAGKDWTIEFGLSVDGGAVGVYQYDGSGAFYGAYLDTNAAKLDSVRFDDWATCKDGFYFSEGKAPEAGAFNWDPATDKPASQLRVDFVRGEGGTMAGGTVTYYKKDADDNYVKIGALNVPTETADNTALPNTFGIHLILGNGKVINPTIKEYVPIQIEEPKDPKWIYVSAYEQNQAMVSYDEKKDTLSFKVDNGWSGRMLYAGMTEIEDKDYAVEFDMNITGGAVGVFAYEPGGVLYGVYLDTGAGTLDQVHFVNGGTCLDDFRFRESTTEGATVHSVVPVENWGASYLKNTRMRVEVSGKTVTYYRKDTEKDLYYLLGSVDLPSDLKKEHANQPIYFGTQLWLGEGTISNFTIGERKAINVYKDPTWVHLHEEEAKKGEAKYNASSKVITFSGKCEGWTSRMINTEIKDLSGQNFAVEFNANLGRSGAIGITPYYEDAQHFYGVYYDIAGGRLDGVGINGVDSKGNLVVLDDFAYINNTIHPSFPLLAKSATGGENVRFRIECFLGKGGTMAGGKVHFYFMRNGFTEWTRMGVITMPTTIEDDPNLPNRLMIHSRMANGTVSAIEVQQGIKNPILPYATADSRIWGYVSDYEKLIGGATFDDKTGTMTLAYDGGWASRMVYLTVPDVSGKAFAMEFNAEWAAGGALGVVPFYEDTDNFYGVFLDRGARTIDGAGYSGGKIIDDFNYADSSHYPANPVQTFPVINWVRYRFEFFPAADGSATGGTCKLFYKTMTEGEIRDAKWRFIGDFTLPETVVDSADKPNKIMIAGRLISATLSDVDYIEITPDTVTEYYNGPEDYGFEDGYPEDDYVPAPVEEAKKALPLHSIVMIAAGGITIVAVAAWWLVLLVKKKKKEEE